MKKKTIKLPKDFGKLNPKSVIYELLRVDDSIVESINELVIVRNNIESLIKTYLMTAKKK